MPFKIDRIENATLYDKDHNPIITLNDIDSISFGETLDSMTFNEDDLKIHMISKIDENLTFEVTGFYTTVEEGE